MRRRSRAAGAAVAVGGLLLAAGAEPAAAANPDFVTKQYTFTDATGQERTCTVGGNSSFFQNQNGFHLDANTGVGEEAGCRAAVYSIYAQLTWVLSGDTEPYVSQGVSHGGNLATVNAGHASDKRLVSVKGLHLVRFHCLVGGSPTLCDFEFTTSPK